MKHVLNSIIALTCVCIIGVVASGCGSSGIPKTTDIEKVIDGTTVICKTAKMLSEAGLEVPGVEQCETILEQLSREEKDIIIDVLKCVEQYRTDIVEIKKCAAQLDFEPVCDRIKELIKD